MDDTPLTALIYARQSLDRDGDRLAVTRQIEDGRALADLRGWVVGEVIVDNSVSASSGKEREGYNKVLAHLRAGTVDRVIVWHIDRLARRMVDLEQVVDLCEASGVRIATVSGDIDLSTDAGRLVARILAAVARAEVERKGSRQRRANQQRREAGAAIWSRRPFGYDRDDEGSPVVVREEAEALQGAAAGVLAGKSLASRTRAMTDAGVTTPAGYPWSATTLARALKNPRYAGRVTYRGEDAGVEGKWPALWSVDTHRELVEILTDPARRSAESTVLKHWLSGLLRCGKCDGPVFAGRNLRTGDVYRCRDGGHLCRRRGYIEDAIEARLLNRLADPAFAAALGADGQLRELRDSVAELRRTQVEIADLVADRLMPAAMARPRLERVAAELEAAEGKLASASGTSPVAALVGQGDPGVVWSAMTPGQRRAVAVDLTQRIVLVPVPKSTRDRRVLLESIQITWR